MNALFPPIQQQDGDYSPEELLQEQKKEVHPAHYYGDIVRKLFLIAGVMMIVGYPFFRDLIDVPTVFAVGLMVAIGLFAGIQTWRHPWTGVWNTAISVVAVCMFEYKAALFYLSVNYSLHPVYFWTNEALALIFFFAIYFSVKTSLETVIKKLM